MTTRPGYIWSGSEWVSIGQEAVVAPVSYQTSAPSTPSTGDIWIDSDDDVPGIDTSQFLRWRKTMSGGETSVSGTDDTGLTLAYTANYEQVYLNGVLLVRGQDYTATNGTSITGLTALAANDVVEVFGVVARVVGDVYTQAQTDDLLDAKSNVSDTGLVLLNTTDFNAASSVSINNIFNSTYHSYRIFISPTATSANNSLYLRLRVNGVDSTGGNYFRGGYYINIGGSLTGYSTNSTTEWVISATSTNYADQGSVLLDIVNPAKAARTSGAYDVSETQSNTTLYLEHYGIVHNLQTAYDGFSLIPSTGNITGTIKVYGYK